MAPNLRLLKGGKGEKETKPKQLDLPSAIMFGGVGFFFDLLGFIPFTGTLFLFTAYGAFRFMGLKAPLPTGFMFGKMVPIASLVPVCTLYVWRVYKKNQPGSILNQLGEVTGGKDALGAVASVGEKTKKAA